MMKRAAEGQQPDTKATYCVHTHPQQPSGVGLLGPGAGGVRGRGFLFRMMKMS